MAKQTRGWRPKRSWGVVMRSPRSRPLLLGELWGDTVAMREAFRVAPRLGQAPTRPMLFVKRAQARTWCAEQQAKYAATYADGHVCRDWRFSVVRVRESWKVSA